MQGTDRAFPFTAIAAGALLACCGNALAMEIDTGNPDVSVRWDNSVRLNYATRVENRDPKIGNSPLSDEGTFSFDRGDAVSKRIDLLSELDVVYKKRHGFRISGAGWYDGAYGSTSRSNPTFAAIPSYVNNQYSPLTKRFYGGPSGEILDAFAFTGFDAGNVPVQAKAGRHTLYWGESLFLGGHLHSVSYSQNSLDLQKGFATPGTEAKELFRPLNQLSAQAQLTDELSVAGQYLLQWESARYPEGGTYLGPVDGVFNGPDRQFLSAAAGFANRGPAFEPPQRGEFGLSARWSPKALDGGTVGFYYRRFADKLPQVLITSPSTVPNGSQYNLVYADGIDLFGASFAKNIAGISFGAEVSTRRNTPLFSTTLGVAPGRPAAGDTNGARGDTWHALMNATGVVPKTALFDAAVWAAELQWSQWSKVRSGANLFFAEGFAPCNGRDKWDGCATKDYLGTSVAFTPTWYQVFAGVDLSAPITYSVGLHGNSAVTFGGNESLGNYSVGLSADVQQKYRFDLKYIDFVGRYKDNGTAVTATNGLNTFLRDRGFVSLTFRTTF
ncbi:DUF1302 family protein [Ramlibacter sp. MAH-25]|uniref:DUF1302 family protein n=2 Tax=Comamonadaceae TaxID=80864 RepID=A0A6N8ITC3_9BURK|nr:MULTISPECIES: DUF1302 domain-containing protein [Ramlibacter]MBA2965206.1 DUF1302 domain-containing protein [Ramlibacter sp. CGMCC 1.13660]MVQ30171.1 DUF1302 family protein [Ramlibacter pinisoli]